MKKHTLVILISLLCINMTACSITEPTKSIHNKHLSNMSSNIKLLKPDSPPRGSNIAYPTALIEGILILENNCLYISSGGKKTLLYFPWGTIIESVNNVIQAKIKINGKPDKVLQVSKRVSLAGAMVADNKKLNMGCQTFDSSIWAISPI